MLITAPAAGRRRRMTLTAGLVAAAVVATALLWWGSPPPVTAAAEVDRLIEKTDPRDRTYVIHNLDPQPEAADDRRPPIDGATLVVRPPDRYSLRLKP